MSIYIQEINNYLNLNVPLFRAMNASLEKWDGNLLVMKAPLEPNINDKGTAFGGSLVTLSYLTGWAITRINILQNGENADIMVTSSVIQFLRPVHGEIIAECQQPACSEVKYLLDRYRQYGKANWNIEIIIQTNDKKTAVICNCQYVVHAIC